MIYTAKITSQGQITIPAPIRKKFFPKGSTVIFEPKDENLSYEVTLKPAVILSDVIGVAAKYGAKIPQNISVESAIKQSLEETKDKIAIKDQQINKN